MYNYLLTLFNSHEESDTEQSLFWNYSWTLEGLLLVDIFVQIT